MDKFLEKERREKRGSVGENIEESKEEIRDNGRGRGNRKAKGRNI